MKFGFPAVFQGIDLRGRGVITAFLVLLVLGACTPRQAHVPEASKIPFGQGRAWQIQGPGIETSTVFATLDRRDERLLSLPPAVEEAFGNADLVAVEEIVDPYIQEDLLNKENLEMAGDETLEELIGARSYGTLSWHMKQRQRRPNNRVKPWVMWYYLGGENFEFGEYDSYYEHLSDKSQVVWLQDRAHDVGKGLVGLQTEQEYFDIYDKMPLDQQADMLRIRVDSYGDLLADAPKVRFYIDGDLARLDALWNEYLNLLQPATAATLNARLITDRNRVMVDRMLSYMSKQTTFVAVGYRHLPGEEGILKLLEQRGFTVTPLG